ncbi:MAG: hypothetical protein ACSHYF_16125 [Verrucomicrobiaceae bacterium]
MKILLGLFFSVPLCFARVSKDDMLVHYFSTSETIAHIVYKNNEGNKDHDLLKSELRAAVNAAFQIFILHENFSSSQKNKDEKNYKTFITSFLRSIPEKEIVSFFSSQLDPNSWDDENIKLDWSIDQYSKERFNKDFKDFLSLRKL